MTRATATGNNILGFKQSDGGSYNFNYLDTDTAFTILGIPEPSTASLLALGLVGIAAMRRQRTN
jgi:hypothetical protein